MSEVIDKDKQQIIDNIQKHINNNKRKLEDSSNNNSSGNSNHNNSNNNNIKSNSNKNKGNNNNNKKQKLRYTHNYNYKLISPFQKYIEFGLCPTLSDLYTEFYHILNENNQDCKCVKLGKELDELNRLNKSGQTLPPNFEFNVRHQHTASEIDSIEFQSTTNRETIELAVRKFCGFLQKESNMVLMEMILLSIGLSKSIEFLHFTLEIERDGGIFTTVTPKSTTTTTATTTTTVNYSDGDAMKTSTECGDILTTTNDTSTTNASTIEPIVRRRTPGGVFYKLINLHLPVGNKTNLFSLSALHKYRGQRRKNGFGVLENLSGKLLDFTNSGNTNNNNNNNTGATNNSSDENNNNSKHLNTLLKEVDEEFDKLCISNNNNDLLVK